MELTPDIFWSREPIVGHKGTKENPAIIPSFNTSRVVGLETEQGVIWFKLDKGPLHYVAGQYFKCACPGARGSPSLAASRMRGGRTDAMRPPPPLRSQAAPARCLSWRLGSAGASCPQVVLLRGRE